MNKILPLVFLIICFVANIALAASKKVLISKIVDHPALDITTKGIIDALDQAGFKVKDNLELRVESAQGSAALASQIASKFVNQAPDVVVAVGTVPAQSFAKYAYQNKIKLIFSSVTDPVSANLAITLENPANNISGVSNFVKLEPQLNLFKKLQPNLKRLGILYNSGEANSLSIVKKLEAICNEFNIVLVKQTISKTADVAQNAAKLASKVEAIFISNDNTALASLQTIVKVARDLKIPVYVSDTDAVKNGAVAALGPNQYEVGLQTGRMVVRALNGESMAKMAIEFPSKTDLYINIDAAAKVGITIPTDILKQANIIKTGI